jgi:hypothetical protein
VTLGVKSDGAYYLAPPFFSRCSLYHPIVNGSFKAEVISYYNANIDVYTLSTIVLR